MARDYQTKSNVGGLPDSITATRFGGGEFNSIATELENAVTTSDQTLAPADGTGEVTDQLAMALAIYGAGGAFYHADTGAVNAYVLTPISPKKGPPAYFDGFTVIFEAGTVNTTASTVNVNSLGVKDITYSDGNALVGGELSGSCGIKYNSSDDRFELLFSSGALSGLQQVYVIDSSQADQGAASSNANTYTVFDAATAIGTTKNATLYFPHNPVAGNQTLFTFDTSLDLSNYPNLRFIIDQGAKFTRNTGDEILTIYSPSNLSIRIRQAITTADMIEFALPGTVYPQWWGATSDGSTDDYAAIQSAINAAESSGGGRVFLPQGSYNIETSLLISKPIIFEGEQVGSDTALASTPVSSQLTTIKWGSVANEIMLRIVSDNANQWIYGGAVRNISFYGTSVANYCIVASSISNWEFLNIVVGYAIISGIKIDSTNGVLSKFNFIDQLYFVYGSLVATQGAYGLTLDGGTNGITQNIIKSISGLVHTGYMILLSNNCDNNHFFRVHASASATGGAIYFSDGSSNPRANLFYYVVGKVFSQANSKGNRILSLNSEAGGVQITSGGQLHYEVLDYVDYGLWTTNKFLFSDYISSGMFELVSGTATKGTSALIWPCIDFPDASVGSAGFFISDKLQLNEGNIIGVRIFYSTNAAVASLVARMRLSLLIVGSGSAIATPSYSVDHDITVNTSAYFLNTYDIDLSGTPIAHSFGEVIFGRIQRQGTDGADTMTETFKLLGIRLVYEGIGPDSGGSGTYDVGSIPI